MTIFTAEEIEECNQAMSDQESIDALELIASGRLKIELTEDKRDVLIDKIDGKNLRDPYFPSQKMQLNGAWPLYRAGMIDDNGNVTQAGIEFLADTEKN